MKNKIFKFIYVKRNKEYVGKLSASNIQEATLKAKKSGLLVDIAEEMAGRPPRLNEKDVYFFTYNLANFLNAGFNILNALQIIKERVSSKKIAKSVDYLNYYISKGATLSNAMLLTNSFSPLVVSLVKSGEESGKLTTSLYDIADYYKTMISLRNKIKNATFYPLIILLASFVALVVYMIFSLPSIKEIYNMVNAELPAITLIVINTATFLVNNWILILLALAFTFVLMRLIILGFTPIRKAYERFILNLPIIGRILLTPEYSRISKTIKNAYASGLPIAEVMKLSENVSSFVIYTEKMKRVGKKINQGQKMYTAFQEENFDPLLVRSIALGEESGKLEDSLDRYVRIIEDEFNSYLGNLTAMIEPISLILIGCIVGIIIVSLYLPMFNMIPAILS